MSDLVIHVLRYKMCYFGLNGIGVTRVRHFGDIAQP